MAMTKKEQAEMEALRTELSLAKALRWPEYAEPAPIPFDEIVEYCRSGGSTVMPGWFVNTHEQGSISQGCSNGHYHNRWGTDKTTAQGGGQMFRSRLDALRFLRARKTAEFAGILANIDRRIAKQMEEVA